MLLESVDFDASGVITLYTVALESALVLALPDEVLFPLVTVGPVLLVAVVLAVLLCDVFNQDVAAVLE